MRNGFTPGAPAQNHIHTVCYSAVGRLGLPGKGRNVEEADFTEPVLPQGAVAAVDRDPDELDQGSTKIDRRVGGIASDTRCLGKLIDIFQHGPVGAVGGNLDSHPFGTKADERFNHLIGIPHQHLVELVGALKLVLNPSRRITRGTEPHRLIRRSMQTSLIETGPVDGVFRSETGL